MKKTHRLFTTCIITLLIILCIGAVTASADNDVIPQKVTISKSRISVYQGTKFELKAKMNPLNADDDYLRWKIVSGKKYVKFADNDHSDDEIELKAVKPGTAKIRCYIKGKSKSKYGDVITVTVRKKKGDYTFSRYGKKTRTVEVGDDFELKVKKGRSIKANQLKWEIADTSIVQFDDNDLTDNDVEFKARKTGTTTVTCICTNKNKKGKKITFKIKVVPETDMDDDDWDDD